MEPESSVERTPITFPQVGSRVWTISGLYQHGPMEGPKTDVPPNTGGVIVGTSKPYYTMDFLLYEVQWDTGERTKHYFKELLCIGPFKTLPEFEHALQTFGSLGELTLGPLGGFRQFRMYLHVEGSDALVQWVKEQADIWRYFEPTLRKSLRIEEKRLPPTRTARRK